MRILLVEDNQMNIELFTASLEGEDYEVVIERNGPAGRQRALSEAFDLVILDIQLPGLDGYAICRDLRAAGVRPILALSSAAMRDQVQKGLDAGFDEYLTKPISPAALRAAVHRLARSS